MALLSVSDAKSYLKIEHTAEDTPLAAWLLSAIAAVEAELGRPIEMVERTFVLDTPRADDRLFVPLYPIAAVDSAGGVAAIEVEDSDGTILIESTDYRVDLRTGIITKLTGGCFSSYPYTVTCSVGLEALDEYATRVEPVINAAILDLLADRYQRRSPGASSEADGGVTTSYVNAGLPQRVLDLLAPWRMYALAT